MAGSSSPEPPKSETAIVPSEREASAPNSGPAPARLESIDCLRGLVMVLMLLDHAREFFGPTRINPTDLETTTTALFLTRWLTHFCAPVFVFLAGTGAYLAGTRGKSRSELSRFLAVRGLWLILLEATVVRFGLTFSLDLSFFPALVFWALGVSMIILSLLIHLPTVVVGVFGIVLIAGHNAFDSIRPADLGGFGWIWTILHARGPLEPYPGVTIFVLYPLVPWVGVMAAGYAAGAIFRLEGARRRQTLFGLGLGLTAAFVVLRAGNIYGDPQPWSVQKDAWFTAFSFLNCEKYPPSLLYLLMTLGPSLIALAAFDRGISPFARGLVTLGRVPLFFFVLQWPLLHLMAIGLAMVSGQPYRWLFGNGPFQAPPGYGHELPLTYAMWAVTLIVLYPPCAWFARLKQSRRDGWLSFV